MERKNRTERSNKTERKIKKKDEHTGHVLKIFLNKSQSALLWKLQFK